MYCMLNSVTCCGRACPSMKTPTKKQLQRLENKKKKMAAFFEIAKLNDRDRKSRAKVRCSQIANDKLDGDNHANKLVPDAHSRKRHRKTSDCLTGGDARKIVAEFSDVPLEPPTGQEKCPSSETVSRKRRKNDDECVASIMTEGVPFDLKNMVQPNEFLKTHVSSLSCKEISSTGKEELPFKDMRGDLSTKSNNYSKDFERVKCDLRVKRNRLRYVPKIKLKDAGNRASLNVRGEARIPLFLGDVQHLLMYSLLGQETPFGPIRWCTLDKSHALGRVVVLLIDGLSVYDFICNCSKFESLNTLFDHQLEVITPTCYNGSLVQELISVPLTEICKDSLIRRYGSLEAALKSNGEVYKVLPSVFPISSNEKAEKMKLPPTDVFSRTKLLLSAPQLLEENYPLPVKGDLKDKYSGYVPTKDNYEEVTSHSPMYSLDCEMCRTTSGELELTRISIVDECLKVVYESLVKPYNKITDYLTHYSGVTEQLLTDVNVRLEDVQMTLRKLLPQDAILIGQSLNFDLHTLKMMHPFVIDTSVIYNLTGDRARKSKLSLLSHKFLKEDIQKSNEGHNPVEDSMASMKLTQLKLSRGIEFGDAVLAARKKEKGYRMKKSDYHPDYKERGLQSDKTAIVTLPDVLKEYQKYITKAVSQNSHNITEKHLQCHMEDSNSGVISRTCGIADEHRFTLAHIKCSNDRIDEKTCVQINNFCNTVWKSLAVNDMYMVLLGGSKSANGACFLQIKKSLPYFGL